MRKTFVLAAALALALSAFGSGDAFAKQCRDAKGKFMKCPPVASNHCRDIKTKKFAKCSAPGTEPVSG